MTDQALIDEIRTAMHAEVDELRVPTGLLAEVLASPPPRRRLPLGWLIPALAVGVAVLVAIVAITSLVHRSPAPRGAAAPVPAAARRLVSRLAVLRRPQTRADVLPAWAVRETESLTAHARVLGDLSRRVGSVHLGQDGSARVYVVVETPQHFAPSRHRQEAPDPRLGDVASIAFVGRFRDEAAIGGPTVSAGPPWVAATAHGLTGGPAQVSYLLGAVASIVPDGVTRVKWVFTRTGRDSGLPPITVRSTVKGNVAIARTNPTVPDYLSSAVWYGAEGRVLESFGGSAGLSPQAAKFKQALEASLHEPISPELLAHFRVLRASVGRSHPPGLSTAAVASLIEPNPVDLNIRDDRFVAYPAPPAKVYVIPGSQGMGLSSEGPIVGQASGGLDAALSGELLIEGPRLAGRRMIVGLVPDGNRTVSVLLPGGGLRTVRVVDNVYSVTVPADARYLVLRNGAGHTVRLRL